MEVPADQTNTKSQSQANRRRRSQKACLSCRSRKVRCNVAQSGRPCMNCYLDGKSCTVPEKKTKFKPGHSGPGRVIKASSSPCPLREQQPANRDAARAASDLKSPGQQPCPGGRRGSEPETLSLNKEQEPRCHTVKEDDYSCDGSNKSSNQHPQVAHKKISSLADACQADAQPKFVPLLNYLSKDVNTPQPSDAPPRPSSDVVYCFYPFLAVANLHNIPHQDVNYLELQGCLRVPTRDLLDDLIQQYFLHVHPILPLLNEGDFWYVYRPSSGDPPEGRFSLLLLQAMLFASCNFASSLTMECLGFQTIRAMRASFYRRAKLLYDLGAEDSHLPMAQAALLLSFASLSSAKKPNTTWLSLAIDSARSIEAHLYAAMPMSSLLQHQAILKRVWWCCIARDRSVGLLMRRPIYITRDHFDFGTSPLGTADLVDEFDRSRVYSPETKRVLAEIFAQSVQLYVVLTDVLTLCFPLDSRQRWSEDARPDGSMRLQNCKLALKSWYDLATARLAMIGGDTSHRSPTGLVLGASHDSVNLYTNFLFMCYHTSRAILCHHEVLHISISKDGDRPTNGSIAKDLSIILDNQHELQDAAFSITRSHEELLSQRLARWLPISAIGCTALPLVLNILDAKLSLRNPGPPNLLDRTATRKQQELNMLIEVMRVYHPQYDGVDWVCELIHHVTNLAWLDNPSHDGHRSNIDWGQIFAFQPNSYLRLALALDFGLSTGRLPHEQDFPLSLREPVAIDFSPVKSMIDASYRGCGGGRNQAASPFCRGINIQDTPLLDSEVSAHGMYELFSTGLSIDDTVENQLGLGLMTGCVGGSEMTTFEELLKACSEILSIDGDSRRRLSDLEDQRGQDASADARRDCAGKESSEGNSKLCDVDLDIRMIDGGDGRWEFW